MFFPLEEFASVFAADSFSCLALAGSTARTHAVVLLVAVIAIFGIAPRAEAHPFWSADDSSGILFVSDAGTETRWIEFPRVQLLAFRDEWYPESHVLAQSQPTAAEDAAGEPLILPPPVRPKIEANLPAPPQAAGIVDPMQDAGAVEPAQDADANDPQQPEESAGIVTEVPAEEPAEEKEEKPAIPDLAKGILIAQNHGDLTFKPGLRIQPRYMYDSGNDNNDFFIRRFRMKASGSAYGVAKYGLEMKIDNEGRFAATPSARAENAWLEFPVDDCELMYMRAGLYDLPFSRDSLTSDSKLLFMDRSLIKEQLTAVGMADNTYGLLFHGRPYNGHLEYAFGVFDNDQFERFGVAGTRESDELMPAGRIVVSLLDPLPTPDGYADYLQSYIGKGQRLEIGANAAHLGDAIDTGVTQDLTAWGVDLFANSGPYTFQAEYDMIHDSVVGGDDVISDGWYAQAGYLFHYDPCDPCAAEFCVRYETLDPFIFTAGVPDNGEQLEWVRVGFNFYIREHNLKVQTDYCFRSGNDLVAPLPGGLGLFDEDVFEVQLQLDF